MHAFEHGKLVIWPNTLFIFSLGAGLGFSYFGCLVFINRPLQPDRQVTGEVISIYSANPALLKRQQPQGGPKRL
jgi:hypothetical protein